MRLPALVRFAAGGLWRQKVRTALTVLGVAVGTAGLAFSLALGFGLRAFIDREVAGRPEFWAVHVHTGRGAVVPEADIPPDAVAVPGSMAPDRRARLRQLKVDAYQRDHPGGPPAVLTADRLRELAALPDVARVDAWHVGQAAVRLRPDGKRRLAQVVGGPLDPLGPRLVAGRLPHPGADEAMASERLLYDLGLLDEPAVLAAFGRPLPVVFDPRPDRGVGLGTAFGLVGDLSGAQEQLLGRVAETLPEAVDALDLTADEKGLVRRLLADAALRKPPAPGRFALAAPVAGGPALVGVVRDLRDAERYLPDAAEPWELRGGEVFLSAAAGDALFGRLPWVRDRGYNSATVRVRPGGDLRAAVAGVEAAGFEAAHLLKYADAVRTQVTLTAVGLNLFALLALAVACLGITNTLVTSVVERTREVGLLRAVGATARQVRHLFLLEGALIGLLGGTLGLAAAVALTGPADELVAHLIERASPEKTAGGTVFEFPVWLFPAGVAFAVLTTTGAAWYPARRAARLPPVAALRA